MGFRGLEGGDIAGVFAIRLDLDLDLLVQIDLGRIHRLGELFGLPGKLVELGQRVLGGIGECGGAPDAGDGRSTDDCAHERLPDNEIRQGRAVKLQDFESFDCVDSTRRSACNCVLGLG